MFGRICQWVRLFSPELSFARKVLTIDLISLLVVGLYISYFCRVLEIILVQLMIKVSYLSEKYKTWFYEFYPLFMYFCIRKNQREGRRISIFKCLLCNRTNIKFLLFQLDYILFLTHSFYVYVYIYILYHYFLYILLNLSNNLWASLFSNTKYCLHYTWCFIYLMTLYISNPPAQSLTNSYTKLVMSCSCFLYILKERDIMRI